MSAEPPMEGAGRLRRFTGGAVYEHPPGRRGDIRGQPANPTPQPTAAKRSLPSSCMTMGWHPLSASTQHSPNQTTMITTSCLVLEASDFTRDNNLKAEAFAAFITASVVVHGNRVVKSYVPGFAGPEELAAPTVEVAAVPTTYASAVANMRQPRQRAFTQQETITAERDPDTGEVL